MLKLVIQSSICLVESNVLSTSFGYMGRVDAMMQSPIQINCDDAHAFLQVQQRTGTMQTAIDAFGARFLQHPSVQPVAVTANSSTTTPNSTTSTTLVPCASTTTTTSTTTTLGQIHPADILQAHDGTQPLTEAERALVGMPIANGIQLTATTTGTPDAWGAVTEPPPQPPSTTFGFLLSPWQVQNAYEQIGPGENCIMGDWHEWSPCMLYEGDGLNQESRTRRREITRGPSRGGRTCASTMQREVCESVQPETYQRVLPSEQAD
eukprot:gnl/MRDRNA2_/MRDRNA2_87721_c0_seq1.p1 gnl/MRDRNA2_/MRDRNA2_87721_c0~~gnl/MRDRNA2_/MRDRNA2_87721_c0_seq1.p1  ORF type:complete len:264 (+),score=32.66 gnl/MRDRNA2_/MRDRNA2_87721_c0_seq1:121-912(+)